MSLLDPILALDGQIAQMLNHFATAPTTFNRLVVAFSEANFVKMAPFVFMVAWFWNQPPLTAHRRTIINGLTGIFIAFCIGRMLQLALPYRPRPLHTAALGLGLPPGATLDILGGWSSFPSDHAAIFAALVGLTFALSRRLGWIAAVYATFVVLLPRVYIGVHFPTDVAVGVTVGATASVMALRGPSARCVGPALEQISRCRPALFHASAILFLVQLSVMFADVRTYGSILKGLLRGTF